MRVAAFAALDGERASEWGYKLNYARDKAVYAAANGLALTKMDIPLAN